MANWISSKLKVAETFFEQIDHQAAESLKKNERLLQRSDEHSVEAPAKSGAGSVSLKDQFKKKTREIVSSSDYRVISWPDPTSSSVASHNAGRGNDDGFAVLAKSSPESRPKLTDADWVELLSSPSRSPGSSGRGGGGPTGVPGLRVDGGRRGSLGSSLSVLEGKNDQKRNGSKTAAVRSLRRSDATSGDSLVMKLNDGDDSCSSARSSNVELHVYGQNLEGQDLAGKNVGVDLVGEMKDKRDGEKLRGIERYGSSEKDTAEVAVKHISSGKSYDLKKNVSLGDGLRSSDKGKHESNVASRSSVSDDTRRDSSSTSGDSTSDSESGSSSDSEVERERERRKKIMAEKAAAKALEAIKERENMVAKLEGEKQSLEKILEERARHQAKEASELQTTMMETMEAVELEKQKHNYTRMEALARLAKLEKANADLARSLATAQKNFEMEIDRVAELRQQFGSKEVALEELKSLKLSRSQQNEKHPKQLAASKGFEIERELLEAEYAFLTDKITMLEDKAKKLEANIELTRKEMEDPTEVETELKRRLAQFTDHLIQKQAQVEALSSEKAMLLFRIEAAARLLEENKSAMNQRDLELAAWQSPDSKLRPILDEKIRSGKKHLGTLVRQLDAIFLAGAVFIRRNPTVKLWALVYLICLHFWVIYILTSQSQSPELGKSGAVISLESINNTANV